MWPNLQFPADLVTFAEESLDGKLPFLCSGGSGYDPSSKANVDFVINKISGIYLMNSTLSLDAHLEEREDYPTRNSKHNLGQNICRLLHFSEQFLFTTNKTELDYYHQKVNVRIASLKCLDLMASTQLSTHKPNLSLFGRTLQKINCKTFCTKTYFA